jgi:hypothetical protein
MDDCSHLRGILLSFQMYTDHQKKEDSADFNYLGEHNDGC